VQNFYQLLSVDPGATPEEIKKAFRAEIARYHPDKVQHLGKEFQEMAAGRAAALTEAYRTLMNAELRAEYDRLHVGAATAVTAGAPAQTVSSAAQPARPVHREAAPPPPAAERTPGPRFASERRDRDDFVRKATLDRFRAALSAEVGQVEEVPARGFDLDCTARSKKLFTREESQRYAVKVVPQVDKVALKDWWNKIEGWRGAEEAKQEIRAGVERYAAAPEKPAF